MNRRDFLSDIARLSMLCAGVPNVWRVTSRPGLPTIRSRSASHRAIQRPAAACSGRVSRRGRSSRTAAWTDCAPSVNWEVADDDKLFDDRQAGPRTAAPELGYSVHVDVDGLAAGSLVLLPLQRRRRDERRSGRFRTAPAADGDDAAALRVRVAASTTSRALHGVRRTWRARTSISSSHLGDYIYEYGRRRRPRCARHADLRDARPRRAIACATRQYKIRPARCKRRTRRCPWLVIWDDHEVDNNYAGLSRRERRWSPRSRCGRAARRRIRRGGSTSRSAFRARSRGRISRSRARSTGDRSRAFFCSTGGSIAAIRRAATARKTSRAATGPIPTRTMLGAAAGALAVRRSRALADAWQVLANQVMMAPFDSLAGPERATARWINGAAIPRRATGCSNAIAQHAPNRTVVITGDIHSNWVNELHSDFDRPDRAVVAAGVRRHEHHVRRRRPDASANWNDKTRAENPHCQWHSARRGYVVCTIDAGQCRADYRTVPYISKRDAPVQTASSWIVAHGKPGVTRA